MSKLREYLHQSGRHELAKEPGHAIDQERFEIHLAEIRQHHDHLSDEEKEALAAYRVLTHNKPLSEEKKERKTVQIPKWAVRAAVGLLIVLLLLVSRSHAQSTLVKGAVKGSTAGNTATVTATDANHNSLDVNCTGCSAASSVTINDPSVTTQKAAVSAAGNIAVECKVGCAGGATTPADTFANPSTAGLSFNFPAVWNGTTWDRLYGDKTNGAFVQLKSSITVPVSGTFWQATQPVSLTSTSASNFPTTVDTNSGNKSASTLRVVLATDQPALTNKLLVTPDSVALPANQSVNVNQVGGTAVVADPCQSTAKLYDSFSGTANTQLITGTSAKKIYFCSFSIIVGAATNVAIVSGTGTVCATGITKFLSGGTTAATGWNFAANGGLVIGNGGAAVAVEANNADNVCVLVSAANQTNINYSYVVQ